MFTQASIIKTYQKIPTSAENQNCAVNVFLHAMYYGLVPIECMNGFLLRLKRDILEKGASDSDFLDALKKSQPDDVSQVTKYFFSCVDPIERERNFGAVARLFMAETLEQVARSNPDYDRAVKLISSTYFVELRNLHGGKEFSGDDVRVFFEAIGGRISLNGPSIDHSGWVRNDILSSPKIVPEIQGRPFKIRIGYEASSPRSISGHFVLLVNDIDINFSHGRLTSEIIKKHVDAMAHVEDARIAATARDEAIAAEMQGAASSMLVPQESSSPRLIGASLTDDDSERPPLSSSLPPLPLLTQPPESQSILRPTVVGQSPFTSERASFAPTPSSISRHSSEILATPPSSQIDDMRSVEQQYKRMCLDIENVGLITKKRQPEKHLNAGVAYITVVGLWKTAITKAHTQAQRLPTELAANIPKEVTEFYKDVGFDKKTETEKTQILSDGIYATLLASGIDPVASS